MDKAIVVRGRLSDPRHIELDEPVTSLYGAVEVVVRAASEGLLPVRDVFDLIAGLPPGQRLKADIDRQLQEDRASWGNR